MRCCQNWFFDKEIESLYVGAETNQHLDGAAAHSVRQIDTLSYDFLNRFHQLTALFILMTRTYIYWYTLTQPL